MHNDEAVLVEWAAAAKRQACEADLEPVPSDKNIMRATVALHMMTRGRFPSVFIAGDDVLPEEFNRSSAIVMMAINFDDDPPSTPERAALFARRLP